MLNYTTINNVLPGREGLAHARLGISSRSQLFDWTVCEIWVKNKESLEICLLSIYSSGCIDFAIRGTERDDADSLDKRNCGKRLCNKLC